MQLTLDNIETKICPKCNRGMKCESIIDNTVTLFCPICLNEMTLTICINCGMMFENDGFKLCSKCNTKEFKKILVDRKPAEICVVEHGRK